MKNIYNVIPKINVALIISGFLLGGYLLFSMSRPYQVGVLENKQMSLRQFDAAKDVLRLPQFSADVFKKAELFRNVGKKAIASDTKSFVLLGVSMGEKKLAIIRDAKANKDYYCTEGDIAADYTVISIARDKVVLEREGITLEITR
jgi:type II secretory pathway component PulC